MLIGGADDDTLDGGDGNDLLVGGTGKDQLTGGAHSDVFAFDSVADAGNGAGRDVIADFLSGTDFLQLSGIDANASVDGNDAFTFIGDAAFTEAGQVRYSVTDGVTVVEADIDGDLVADCQVELVGMSGVAAADFIL